MIKIIARNPAKWGLDKDRPAQTSILSIIQQPLASTVIQKKAYNYKLYCFMKTLEV
jgi:hypothetical protein